MKFFSLVSKEVNISSLFGSPSSPQSSGDFHRDYKTSNPNTHLAKRRKAIMLVWFLITFVIYFAIKLKMDLRPDFGSTIISLPNRDLNYATFEKVPRSSSAISSRILCKIMPDKSAVSACKSYTVADVLDLAWVINPLFRCRGVGSEDENLLKLYKNFKGYLKSYGIPSISIEAIKLHNSNQKYQVTRPNMEPYEIQTYFHNCSYMKNNLINRAIRKLELPWEYMLSIDAHQIFENPFWIFDAIVQAEKHAVVQLFDRFVYLYKQNQSIFEKPGFVAASLSPNFDATRIFEFGSGFILRRELYEKLGYIIDECVAGDCDAIYNKAAFSNITWNRADWFPQYAKNLQGWLDIATPIFNGSRGFVRGNVVHFHHQEGTFPFEDLHYALDWLDYDIEKDFQRDENFAYYFSNKVVANTLEHLLKHSSALYKHFVDDKANS